MHHMMVPAPPGDSSGICVQSFFAQHDSASLLLSVMLVSPHSRAVVMQYVSPQHFPCGENSSLGKMIDKDTLCLSFPLHNTWLSL